jgi:hypothetical protein
VLPHQLARHFRVIAGDGIEQVEVLGRTRQQAVWNARGVEDMRAPAQVADGGDDHWVAGGFGDGAVDHFIDGPMMGGSDLGHVDQVVDRLGDGPGPFSGDAAGGPRGGFHFEDAAHVQETDIAFDAHFGDDQHAAVPT